MRATRVLLLLLLAAGATGGYAGAQDAKGTLQVDITNILGKNIPARIDLVPAEGSGKTLRVDAPKGQLKASCPAGRYRAYVYAYDWDIPILIKVMDLELKPKGQAYILENLIQGSGKNDRLRDFDNDHDLVLDALEATLGTDPHDAASFPGARPVAWENRVLEKKEGWFRGDLHVRSIHGGGKESVAELVKRAEQAGLDFIAITDRNTMAACQDPAFKSDKVVLIPAMEWGDEEKGVALIYGPKTFPHLPHDFYEAQGTVYRVQGQGGIFAIAHPCFPHAPWQRGLGFVNAIEVWCRDYRDVPPISAETLDKRIQARTREGELVHSIAIAAATGTGLKGTGRPSLSANGQAAVFWDIEMTRGLRACPIAGSLSSSPDVPMGRPMTYVYAKEKSVRGILEGIRQGFTFVTTGPDGPQVDMWADVLNNDYVDANLGDIIPTNAGTVFYVTVTRAMGKKCQVLENGRPIITKIIDTNDFGLRFEYKAAGPSTFRVRVVDTPTKPGFGELDVLAMSGAIYAREMIVVAAGTSPEDTWVPLRNRSTPPVFANVNPETGRPTVMVNPQQLKKEFEAPFTPPQGAEIHTLPTVPLGGG